MKINVDSENESPPLSLTPSNASNTAAMNSSSRQASSSSSSAITALSPKTTNIIQHQPSMVHNHPLSFGGGDQHNEIFQLQIEIQSLKNRLKQASSAQKHELLELLQEKDTVIQTKSKQISTLNEKFLKITKAVAQMEREVEVLRRDKEVLEEDHKKLKRHLNIREKEVTALVTRCTAQEEKLVELKSSRVLEKQLQEVQAKLEESDRHVREMEDLDRQLLQSNREREDVMHRFEKEKEEKETLQRHLSDTKEQLEGQLKSRDESLVQLREQVEALTLSRDQKDAHCRELGKTVEDLQQKVTDMEISAQNNKVQYEREIARLEEKISQENRQHKDIVESLQRSKEQDMEMMNLQMQKGDQAMASVLNEVHVLKHENNALQKSVKDLDTERNTMIENLSSEKQALQENLENLKNELDVKTKEAMKLNDVVQKIKEQQQQSLMETTTFKEKIGSLEDQVEMLTAREKQLTMEIQQVLDQNTSLSHEKEDMKKNIAEMKKFHQEQLAKAEAEKRAMKEEYDDMLQESESLFKDEYAKYESEHMQVQKLRLKLEQVTAQATSQEKLRIMETQLLEESIKTAKMQLEAKEREIAIKNENLREERSKVTDLEATVKVLERSLRKNEIDAAARIEELNLKVNEGTARYAKLEEEKDNIITESKKARAKLQDKIMLLETEFTNLKGEIVSKDSQLEQRQSTIKSLLTVKEELEQKIRSYNDDVQTLMAAYEETKDEYSNSLRKLKAEREKDNVSLKAEYNQMKASAVQTESELDSALKANQRLKDLISEKTRVVGDLEARIEELERGNDDKETIISDLQNKYHAEQDMVDELKRRISSLNFEKKKEIKIHLDTLEEERSLCLDLQKRLEETQMKLDEWKDNAKENRELKAENFLLKDKIDRQQAFIERKLENEKKKRGQVICNPNPNLKSPPRRSSARSRSLTRKSIDAPRLGLGAPRNRSSSTSVGPTDSPELQQKSASDELDELLGTFNEI